MKSEFTQPAPKTKTQPFKLQFLSDGRLAYGSAARLREVDRGFCSKCKKVLPLTDFNTVKGKPRAYCKDCTRSEGRKSAKKRYHREGNGIRAKRAAFARLILAEANRGCYLCGYNQFLSALEYHHFEKLSFRIPDKYLSILGSSGDSQLAHATDMSNELKKCEVVCANCHNAIHAGEIDIHGSLSFIKGIRIAPQRIVELANSLTS